MKNYLLCLSMCVVVNPLLAISREGLVKKEQPYNLCETHLPKIMAVPRCPKIPMLDESYPTMALTVSDVAGGRRFLFDYLEMVLSLKLEKPPTIYTFVDPENYAAVLSYIDGFKDPAKKKLWSRSIIPVTINNWNWQQDYFEVFYNKLNGLPVARALSKYRTPKDSPNDNPFFDAFPVNVNVSCPIERGAELKVPEGPEKGGYSGGNIEAIKNFCLLGDATLTEDEWTNYAAQICDSAANVIKVPTWFMSVGHTDEILKTLPVKKSINSCGYALGLANTERAIELLEKEPEKKAFEFDPRLSSIKQALMFSSVSYAPYCVAYKAIHQKRFSQIVDQSLKAGLPIDALAFATEFLKKNRMPAQNRVTRYTREQIREILATLNEVVRMREISRHRMGVATYQFVESIYEAVKNKTEDQLLNSNWTDFTYKNPLMGWNTLMWYMDCAEMKNKDILEIFAKYPEFRRIQTQVQTEMNKARDLILEKFRQKEPGCTPKIVSFPYLFNHRQGKHLFEAAEMVATFPNTTNSEILGENILVPDPSNSTLKSDIERTLKSIGYAPQFIDTNYQHALFGNLHCSTHAFRYCRP